MKFSIFMNSKKNGCRGNYMRKYGKMNIWHPGQLKKLKSWGSFWTYQLNSNANLAHLPRNRAK